MVHVIISLYCCFSSASSKVYLLDPALKQSKKRKLEVENVNMRVVESMETQMQSRKQSDTTYSCYSPELSATVEIFAAKCSNKAAFEKFCKEIRKLEGESTVRGLKKHYYEALKQNWTDDSVTRLKHGLRGQPLKLGTSRNFKLLVECYCYCCC